MTLTGGEIHELIQLTASCADRIQEIINKSDKDQIIQVNTDYYELKKFEHVLIMCEDVIKNARFTFAQSEE